MFSCAYVCVNLYSLSCTTQSQHTTNIYLVAGEYSYMSPAEVRHMDAFSSMSKAQM